MSDFSATDVAFSGIRFVRHHPRSVAIWAGIQLVISLVVGVLIVALFGPYLTQLQALSHASPTPDRAAAMAAVGRIWQINAFVLPLSLVLYSMIYATLARAVLEPAEERMGYIRLGMDEVRQGLLLLLWFVVCIGAEALGFIVVLVPTLIVKLALNGPYILIMVLCILLVLAAVIYFLVRLSLASPLTFDRRKVDLFGSWRLTRGRFWKMLATYLLVTGLALVIGFLIMIITVAVAGVLGGLGAMASIFQPSMMTMGTFFLPARLAVTVIWAFATPLFWALFFMPASEIYRQIR